MSFGRLIRLAVIPTLAVAWVVLQYAQLDGKRTIVWHPGERLPFINSPLPAERVNFTAEGLVLQGDPIYLHVTPPPGRWQTVRVTADINPGAQPVIELGTVVNARQNALDLRPVHHAVLSTLGPEWSTALKDGLMIATRSGTTPTWATTRVYRAPSPDFSETTWALGRSRALAADLQGGHEWWVYGQAGQLLSWSADVIDQNLVDGPDELSLVITTAEGLEIARTDLPDVTSHDQRAIEVSSQLPATGAYKVVLSSTSDITWLNNTTNAQYLAARNHLRLAAGSKADLWTTAAVVGVEEPVGKRAIGLGEGEHVLTDLAPGAAVVGEGYFALTRQALWSPTLTPLTQATDLSQVNQIIATPPTLTQEFAFGSLEREGNGSFRVILSLPNVQSLEAANQPILNSVTLIFQK